MFRRSELQLSRDTARRFIPLMIAAMVYLATLALAGAIGVGATVDRWSDGLRGTLTVQLPGARGDSSAAETAARTDTAVSLLLETPGVATAQPVPPADLEGLLEPWLGKGNLPADLPVPVLIDVTLDPGATVDLAALQRSLTGVVPGARVSDNGVYLERLVRLARSVQLVAGVVMLLVLLAAVSIIVFATRAGLSMHRETIELLHLIGARDSYIARQFVMNALWHGLLGGILGVLLAAATVAGLGVIAGEVQLPLAVPKLPANLTVTLALWAAGGVAVPLVAGAVAMATARLTVMRTLRQVL